MELRDETAEEEHEVALYRALKADSSSSAERLISVGTLGGRVLRIKSIRVLRSNNLNRHR